MRFTIVLTCHGIRKLYVTDWLHRLEQTLIKGRDAPWRTCGVLVTRGGMQPKLVHR